MSEFEQANIDTSFEDLIIEQKPGVRQRALAVRALVELTELTKGSIDSEIIEQLRGLSKEDAGKIHKSLAKATRLIRGITPQVEEKTLETATLPYKPHPLETIEPAQPVEEKNDAVEVIVQTAPVVERVVAEETTIESIEPKTSNKPLTESALAWLEGMIDGDIKNLTTDDIPRIMVELKYQRGPLRSNSSVDYDELILGRLSGLTPAILADTLGSTPSAISQAFTKYRQNILNKRNASQISAVIINEVSELVETPTAVVEEQESETAEPEIKKDEKPQNHAETLSLAVEKPAVVSNDEWIHAAETAIKSLAENYVSEDNADAFWTYIHFDDAGDYRQANARVRKTIEEIRSRFTDVVNERFVRGTAARMGLQMLFNNSMGYKNLDSIHNLLHQKELSETKTTTQRHIVLAVYEMLRA
jgi:hypothetical protein